MAAKSGRDFYAILGVARDADDDALKKAYRKAALKWHPDRHSSASDADKVKAEAMFKDVTEANTVLSDASQRSRYDASLGSGEAFDPSGSSDGGCCCGGGGGHGGGRGGMGGGMGGMDPAMVEMLFAQMMGGMGGGGGRGGGGMGGFPPGMFGGRR
jgi:DnaJ-class molecular chaperone